MPENDGTLELSFFVKKDGPVIDGRELAKGMMQLAHRLLVPYASSCPACTTSLFTALANEAMEEERENRNDDGTLRAAFFVINDDVVAFLSHLDRTKKQSLNLIRQGREQNSLRWGGWYESYLYFGKTVLANLVKVEGGRFMINVQIDGCGILTDSYKTGRDAKRAAEAWARTHAIPIVDETEHEDVISELPANDPKSAQQSGAEYFEKDDDEITDDDIPF